MNTGSFAAGMPSQDAVQEAMRARNMGTQPVSPLSQTPQGSGSAPPQMPTTQAPMPQGTPQAVGSPTNGLPPAESELIVKALSQRLQSISSVEKSEVEGLSAPVGG